MRKSLTMLFAAMLFISTYAGSTEAASQTHTVQRGDTLWSIAREYKTTVGQLKQWNNLKSDSIAAGKSLIVSADQATTTLTTKPAATQTATTNKVLTMKSTAYTASCRGCSGITATGINLKKNPYARVIAVDPRVIPLGTKVHVEGYGTAIAGDKGGSVKGNKIDVFISNKARAKKWGNKTVKVTILK